MKPLWYMRGSLLDQAGDGTGAGAGSGAGAGDKPGADLTAFMTEVKGILGEYRKDINTVMKTAKGLETKFTQQNGKGGGSGDGSGDTGHGAGDGTGDGAAAAGGTGAGDGKPKLDANTRQYEARLKSLETLLADEKKAREGERTARRNAERDSLAQKTLAGFAFADEEAGKDAFDLVAGKLKWADDGALVGPDGETPAEDWIKAVIAKKTHLLAPKTTGGAGARGGASGAHGAKAIQLEDIKPGMSKEDIALTSQALIRALRPE